MVAFMKRKIEQRCPVYKTREDIIDTWFLGLSDLDKSVGFKNISKEEVERVAVFGYELDRNNRLKINDAQADIIREIYWMYIWSIPLKEICWKTKDESKYFFSENEWTEEKIQEILNNEIYAGYKFIKTSDGIILYDYCKPIIDKKIYVTVQKIGAEKEIKPQDVRLEKVWNICRNFIRGVNKSAK